MRMNLLDDEGWLERTHPPAREGFDWKRKRVAGDQIGASLYELGPGQRTFPSATAWGMTSCWWSSPPANASRPGRQTSSPRRLHPLPERAGRGSSARQYVGRAGAFPVRLRLRAPAGGRPAGQRQADDPAAGTRVGQEGLWFRAQTPPTTGTVGAPRRGPPPPSGAASLLPTASVIRKT